MSRLAKHTERILAGGVRLRKPYPSERQFFRRRPDVAGMASADGAVVLNPYTNLSEEEWECVCLNEASRVVMATKEGMQPTFDLTPDQQQSFSGYGTLADIRATVAARILSGDPSALEPTDAQIAFVLRLANAMGVDWDERRLSTSNM